MLIAGHVQQILLICRIQVMFASIQDLSHDHGTESSPPKRFASSMASSSVTFREKARPARPCGHLLSDYVSLPPANERH